MKKHHRLNELRHRCSLITAADNTVSDCECLIAVPVNESNHRRMLWLRAAKLYGIAADHYRRASLGMSAIAAWNGAAKCYGALGLEKDREQCERKANAIPHFFEEDDT